MADNKLFFNRELSWIEFNARVLNQAFNTNVPLLERLKFMSIATSNFDEFFMVRVAGLKRTEKTQPDWRDSSNLTAGQQLKLITKRIHELTEKQYQILNTELLPALSEAGIKYIPASEYTVEQQNFTKILFHEEIFPLLTPLRVEDDQPFPYITNLRLHIAFRLSPIVEGSGIPIELLHKVGESPLAIVQIPRSIKRVIWLPSINGIRFFTLVDDVISLYGTQLFPGYSVDDSMLFKVTCDADISVDEETNSDFIHAMEEVLSKRQTALPVRIACSNNAPELQDIITKKLGLTDDDTYTVNGLLDLTTLLDITNVDGYPQLKYPIWHNFFPAELDTDTPFWDILKKRDILLNVPYESYDPVINLINTAASDDDVLAIKITLYRTSGNSPIVHALERAVRNGKQVTAFVELKARFDEKQNISWATQLEHAGVIVVHGIVNLKVHAKLLLIVRKEQTGIKRYVHLSTGNYNDKTARQYSDLSLFTSNYEIANDATLFFNMISGYSSIQTMTKLSMAPINLKSKLIGMIEREIQTSSPESPGLIMAKMNSLAHEEIIEALYKASRAGVTILLNVRGICMLVPGVEGKSTNISVVSIVDRFLEHSRIFYFKNGGAEEIYLSSADWMPRNLDRRVELMFPVAEDDLFKKLKKQLSVYFSDNTNAYILQNTGEWIKKQCSKNETPVRAQAVFYNDFKKIAELHHKNIPKEFTVRRSN